MKGFILHFNRAKDEDLIVHILTSNSIETLYRFYGARHGSINIGFFIDFQKEYSLKSNIPRLKDVIHIGFKWICNLKLLQIWQEYVKLFYKHLRDTYEIDEFYFELLVKSSQKWDKQNPKRVAIESYIELLEFEGRLHKENRCFLCSNTIEDNFSLLRAFLPSCKDCSNRLSINRDSFYELVENHSTLFLNDEEIEKLWYILLEGF